MCTILEYRDRLCNISPLGLTRSPGKVSRIYISRPRSLYTRLSSTFNWRAVKCIYNIRETIWTQFTSLSPRGKVARCKLPGRIGVQRAKITEIVWQFYDRFNNTFLTGLRKDSFVKINGLLARDFVSVASFVFRGDNGFPMYVCFERQIRFSSIDSRDFRQISMNAT